MKISLSPELERLIEEKVESGLYGSAEEVVRKGLELLKEHERVVHPPPSNGTCDLLAILESISNDVPIGEWERLPTDLSKNLDHYLYGGPKKS
jgi:hypothetical protein